eukprot:TRINITY_DN28101_c0_g1_i1.p1 TRINITY_DN28101_c0_g1~~TRINITY_DN28101_c0_g1_i1.p1  ORF type:complete len:137 (-),score=10.54 TRINITY_DN28101_c0_g1_i1:35-445(-)
MRSCLTTRFEGNSLSNATILAHMRSAPAFSATGDPSCESYTILITSSKRNSRVSTDRSAATFSCSCSPSKSSKSELESSSSSELVAARWAARVLRVGSDSRAWSHVPVSYTHLRAHETPEHLVCRLLLEKKKIHQL